MGGSEVLIQPGIDEQAACATAIGHGRADPLYPGSGALNHYDDGMIDPYKKHTSEFTP